MKAGVKARRYFAGANTKHGFYNFFGQINRTDVPGFLYILKGGPGTGKSTLMKSVGSFFAEKTDVEYFYCSSDHESLDGVRIPAINTAIVDGTAPHITETVMPGIREKIVDLGAFIGSSVKQSEKEIAHLIRQKQLFFKEAYLYIKNASNLFDCNNLILSAQNKDAESIAAKKARKILREAGLGRAAKTVKTKKGNIRRLFLLGIAGGDFVDFTLYNNYGLVLELDYDAYLSGLILKELAAEALERGLDVECFCEALSPESLNGVFIPKADVLIKSKREVSAVMPDKRQSDMVFYNNAAISDAIYAAGRALEYAKNTHKKIEEFYIPAMNFSAVGEITQQIITEIYSQL